MNPLTAALYARSIEAATGALDWTDGKRRRVFFFEHGEIVLTQSNLKSEGTERLVEQQPGLSGDALLREAARVRLAGALRETGGEARWIPNAPAPRREPADLSQAVWDSGPRRPPMSAYPKIAGAGGGWVQRQAMPPDLARYLVELDGSRTLDEVLSFAPAGQDVVERWIHIAFAVGALVDVGIESATYEVRSVSKKRDFGGSVDDIASLISEGLGQEPTRAPTATVADPATVRFGPALPRIRGAADHFAALGVSWQDPPESMRRAYVALARELHPDGFVAESAELQAIAAELFDKVRAAWEVLGDENKREAYIKRVIKGEKTEDELAMDKVRAILDAEGDFKKGLVDFAAGRIAAAHECFVAAAASVPEEMEFAAYAGYTTYRIHVGKNPEKAAEGLAKLRTAVETSERLDTGWVLIGLTHHAKGEYAEAREAYIKALKIKPSNPDAVREMKRLERDKQTTAGAAAGGSSLFNRFFGGKK
ncbi:hypothetical protein LBMAG42_33470 [Deltaproteobacteria bacterium]|nr:hypothetical protein LBMAG42_33470 [Deltaproteobacteria bacterium]